MDSQERAPPISERTQIVGKQISSCRYTNKLHTNKSGTQTGAVNFVCTLTSSTAKGGPPSPTRFAGEGFLNAVFAECL